jgi:tetratricopeptide (TPR) repeat protein
MPAAAGTTIIWRAEGIAAMSLAVVRLCRLALLPGVLVLAAACGSVPVTGTASPPSPTVVSSGAAAQLEVDLGLEAHVAGDYDRALTHYRRALAGDPWNKFAHYNIGVIEQLNGRMTQAEAEYRAALATDRNYVPALFNLAIVRTLEGDLDEAAELYEHVIQLEPDRAGAHLNLGLVLARLGRTEEAEVALQRAIELDPDLGEPDVTSSPDGS